MKKLISILFICFMCIALIVPCFAAEFKNPPILDNAGYLSDAEFEELSEKLEEIRQKYNFDVAIVTESEYTSYDAVSSADDIYDYEGYGAGASCDGIMFYICSSERKYHITTFADGLRVFNDNGIGYLKEEIQPYLADGDFYYAMVMFADCADELLEMAENGEPYNVESYDEESFDFSKILITFALVLIIPLVIAWMMMKMKLAKMKTAVANNYAANYIKNGSKQITYSRDIFLYSHITKTEKPKSSGSSSSHRSSSGRTHGGGGGSF